MLMVANFWDMETHGAGLRACAASTDYDAVLIQDGAHMRELEVDKAQGSGAQLHGVMLKVERESDGGLHSVLMEGLWCKISENRSLFQRDSERYADRTGYQWSDGDVILGIGR